MTDVRAITVRPLWSEAIVEGHKRVENRSGGFPRRHRGRLLIHSAKTWSVRAQYDERIYESMLRGLDIPAWLDHYRSRAGMVIGEVNLVDAHSAHGCCRPWGEDEYADAQNRRTTDVVHLRLEQPIRYEHPIPARGALGLWRPSDELLLACAQVDEPTGR